MDHNQLKAIRSRNRSLEVSTQRHILCLFLRQKHNSLNEIGRYVKRNHSTVVHSIRRAKELLEIKDEIATRYYNDLVQ